MTTVRRLSLAGALLGLGAPACAAPVVCGQVLTESISLDNDLVDCPGDGLVIGAHGITVTFAGHSIRGTGAAGSAGVRNVGYDRVTLQDGDHVGLDISGFEVGVLLQDAKRNVVRDLFIHEPFRGLFGIRIVGGRRHTLRDNDVRGGAFDHCAGVTAAAIAVFDSHDNRIEANQAHLADFGIALVGSDHNQLVGNEAAPEFSDGNACVGIAVFDSHHNEVTANVAAHSADGGILVAAGSTMNALVANLAVMNGEDGIHAADRTTTLTDNAAVSNLGYGIRAVPGTGDGGGNTASDNGAPSQCLNVSCSP